MESKNKWNTENLLWRVGADVTSAATAGVLIAPVITIIDRYVLGMAVQVKEWLANALRRSIIENASGKRSISASMVKSAKGLLLRPHHFLFSKPFALIFVSRGSIECVIAQC